MSFLPLSLSIVVGFICCWGLIPVIRKLAAKSAAVGRTDDFHHTHKTPVPRLGGIALVAAFFCVASVVGILAPVVATPIALRIVIVLGSLAMFGVGLWDDFRPLGARIKLLAQFAIATAVYFGGIQIEVFKNPFTNTEYALGFLGFAGTVLWLVTLTNLINLIDGLDGLAGGIAFMLMCLLANVGMGVESIFTTLVAAGMAGALLGFLYYNFPPAKIYMGDGGAYFLGFLIGTLSIHNSHKGSVAAALIAPLFALALPIVDVALALLRRGLKGLPLFRPDRKHIHHRLVEFGLSRQRTVLVLYSISCLCLFLAFAAFWLQGKLKLPLLLGSLFLILIIAGRSFGLIKNWFGLLTRLLKSLELRQETRYALTLSQWLEMEAERRDSVYELWQDYQFVVKKLGFSEVKVTLPDGANTWRASGVHARAHALQKARHETPSGALEFSAEAAVLPEKLFELLAELAAEAWHKSSLKWQEKNQAPLRFVSVASADTSYFKRKLNRLYSPAEAPWWEKDRLVQSG